MSNKQATLTTLLTTFQELLENTFDSIPQDLIITISEIKTFIKDTKPKAI